MRWGHSRQGFFVLEKSCVYVAILMDADLPMNTCYLYLQQKPATTWTWVDRPNTFSRRQNSINSAERH